jgi:hypothetical protein
MPPDGRALLNTHRNPFSSSSSVFVDDDEEDENRHDRRVLKSMDTDAVSDSESRFRLQLEYHRPHAVQ